MTGGRLIEKIPHFLDIIFTMYLVEHSIKLPYLNFIKN